MKIKTKKGSYWALFGRTHIPDRNAPDKEYLFRLRIIECPLFGVYLHKILRADSDPSPHDHPWNFVSIILKGGYLEFRQRLDWLPGAFESRWYLPKQINVVRDGDYHVILELSDNKPVWSLLFVGRRKKSWGFLVDGVWVDAGDHFTNIGEPQLNEVI